MLERWTSVREGRRAVVVPRAAHRARRDGACAILGADERARARQHLEGVAVANYDPASAAVKTIPLHRVAAGVRATVVAGAVALVVATTAAGAPVLNLTLSGTAKGKPLKGKVQFARLICASTSTQSLSVVWNGSLQAKPRTFVNVSGDMSFGTTGKSAFGTKVGDSVASLLVNNDYSSRFGSGLRGGSGTATIAKNRKSGSVDVVVVSGKDKVRIQGGWVCG
jgi:hypothetical protein